MSRMSQPESRALVLSALVGAAGISLALVWYSKTRKSRGPKTLTDCYLSNHERHSQLSADDWSEGAVLLFQEKQAEMLEKLTTLILCVSELKDEVKSLQEGIPKLQEQVREGLRGKLESHKISPLHRATRRKRTVIPREEHLSSEEAESEGGYVTAHTDTEEESDEGNKDPTVNFPAKDLVEEKDEFMLLMQKIDSLHRGPESEKKEGFMMLLEKKDQYGQEVPFLWRLARAYGDMFDLTSDIEDKKSYTEAGKKFAEEAITLDPMSADSHQWFAIMCGYMSEYESVQNRIKNGYLFKDHLDKAIELNPQDPLSYYLLGRWCYAVSQLSWIERKVAATLFGNPPTATIQDALHYFHKL
ncbi:regulator of microtubule dynamics protein 2-like isoform X2 [Polyodon spathula]|uniref:regulator of microtubule dynamics protein 2-like isoform X2 n=1 Tax=Polyodon spathula TaxID=7913 RepID=UPI001B7F0EB8|nr:regulator of microtubule dynamics protein 2-like isoform X2 [Polyodon spathula]